MNPFTSHVDNLILQALMWSPPQSRLYASGDDAHESGAKLIELLGGPKAPALDSPEWEKLMDVAAFAAAADYLPGRGVDDDWLTLPAGSVRHPLSSSSGDLLSVQPSNPQIMVDQWIALLPKEIEWLFEPDTGSRDRALWLWRRLPDLLAGAGSPHAGAGVARSFAWGLTEPPAHPAYPDSVGSVGSFRAAVAAAGSEPALLLFTIASVQDFIGAARRTQDLWMGSFLYAYFTWSAMRPIVEALGPWSILSPQLRGQPLADLWLHEMQIPGVKVQSEVFRSKLTTASLPNLFMALVPSSSAATLAEAGRNAVIQARDHLGCVFNVRA